MISFKHKDEGFTGLEAAIVLIAFVVVAAVFSYVVLGAGFFTTQKSQEVVHTGVQQASSTLQIAGEVYGNGDATSVKAVNFSIQLAPGGTPIDVSKMVVTYSTGTGVETLGRNPTLLSTATQGVWSVVSEQNPVVSDWLLEKGETFGIMVYPSGAGIGPDTTFTIELKPITGAALDIKRTTPAGLQAVNILY